MSNSIPIDELTEGIAIIGMSGRFPGARDLDQFWRNLRDGVESVSFFSDEQLKEAGMNPEVRQDPNYVGAGGVLPDIEMFDASFFGFNPREAEAMDPQHRLFLECAWETMENGGYDPQKYSGSVGVYAGTGFSTYFFNLYENQALASLLGGHQIMIGNDKDHLTTRVSYKLNLRGPSLTIQTACSTSLVAVCVACRSLLDYQCDMALAGGSSIAVPQGHGYFYREGGIASPDGHCRPFDSAARGTVAGNGVGVVLLKRYADAIADRDHIRAVIRGSAINNDGGVKVGYTAPSVDGQAEVIAMAQAVAGVSPESITYIEAHGTGTPLGDPIEMAALSQVFAGVNIRNHCAVGSVKSNIGHLDTAAGVAGLIKTVLALEDRTIPPSLHFHRPNPKLNLEGTPFYISARTSDWKSNGHPRRAGVSSFGIGGTNAHVVLEEAPQRCPSGSSRPAHLMLLSAPTASGLSSLAGRFTGYLRTSCEASIADVAYSAAVGRKTFRHRLAWVCRDPQEAAALLEQRPRDRVFTAVSELMHRPLIFLFSGQGAQYPGMTAQLYHTEPVFREHLDVCFELLERQSELTVRSVLNPERDQNALAEWQITQTATAQPVLFAIEYALAKLWMAWGVKPEYMIGHSIGEYVAACLAGVFSLDDALRLIALRGRLMQSLPVGAMMAVPLPEGEIAALLGSDLSLAAVNAPSQCVLSGPAEAIERAAAVLAKRGADCVRLKTSHAFHSAMMDPILPAFTDAIREVDLRPPSIPFISNVTGDWITAADATDPQYWARHLRQCVRFSAGLERILKEPHPVLLEVGPGQALIGFARQQSRITADTVLLSSVRRAPDPQDDFAYLLRTLGRLWIAGVEVDWHAYYSREQRLRVPLPPYPFERKRFWIDASVRPAERGAAPLESHKKSDISEWFYVPSWKRVDILDGSSVAEKRTWMVLSEGSVGSALAGKLRARGHSVTVVQRGEKFEAISSHAFTIHPERGSDYAALIDELGSTGQTPSDILHCWSLTPEGAIATAHHAQRDGFHSLLHLARALSGRVSPRGAAINVISNHLHSVLSTDFIEPMKATVLGPCIVIPQEQPGFRCRSIDVPFSDAPVILDSVLEDCTAPVADTVIAYRGGRRWVRCFEPVHFPENSAKSIPLLRPSGVYLITGGFGNIGITLAEALARCGNARLTLLTRRALPPRREWEDWLDTNSRDDVIRERIRAVRALEALGARVLVINGDVTQRGQMHAAIERTLECFGDLNGVIHAAGAMDASEFRPASQTDRTVAERHFAPKIIGTEILEDVLRGRELDFCMLMSSLSTVLGGLNLSAYAAANSFMDAFAEKQNQQQHTRWISVNWDGWRFEKGSAAPSEFFLTPAEGAEVFRRVLARKNVTRVVVSTGNLDRRLDLWVRLKSGLGEIDELSESVAAVHERPQLETAYFSPRNALEQMVADVWQAVLGVSSVGVQDNFFELGGNSLVAIQLISRLRDLFQVDIEITALFELPTIAQLTRHIEGKVENTEAQGEELAKMLDYVERLSPEEVKALLANQQGG
ncbi:MAG: SDR family NAD(P)-dependent oxidoreductase [Terriglobia bacterium]